MNRPLSYLWKVAIIAITAFAISACGGDDEDTTDEPSGTTGGGESSPVVSAGPARQAGDDTLVAAWVSDLTSMDPPVGAAEANWAFGVNVYEPLVGYAYTEAEDGSLVWDGLGVTPQLAESWEIDGATVTFKLREGVKFYPSGNEMTAEDVKYSFVRTPFVEGGSGRFNSNLAGIFDAEQQVEVVDDYTLAIHFTDAEGNPLLNPVSIPSLRFVQFHILDSEVVKSHATADDPWALAWVAENTAGTGPYFVESRLPGQETILQAIPDHWNGMPDFTRIIFRVTAGADVVSLMKGGEIDYVNFLGTRELDELAEAGFKVLNHPIPNIVRADLPLDAPGLEDPMVRQALAYAMPYDQIIQTAFSGRGERAYSVINPKSPGFDPSWETYTNDLDKAQELLDEAGVSDLSIPIFYDSSILYFEDIALLMKDTYSQIGVNLELRGMPTAEIATLRTAQTSGEGALPGIILNQGTIWLDDPDPTVQCCYQALGSTGKGNLTQYTNATVDELHFGHRFDTDETARAEAYTEIQQILADEVPTIPIIVTGRTIALHPSLTKVLFTADQHPRLWFVQKVQ